MEKDCSSATDEQKEREGNNRILDVLEKVLNKEEEKHYEGGEDWIKTMNEFYRNEAIGRSVVQSFKEGRKPFDEQIDTLEKQIKEVIEKMKKLDETIDETIRSLQEENKEVT